MYSHCINKLLNLEEVIVKNIIPADHFVKIFIETKPTIHSCPSCGSHTKRTQNYHSQEIKDLRLQLKHFILLVLRKRRYLCTNCGTSLRNNILFQSCQLVLSIDEFK